MKLDFRSTLYKSYVTSFKSAQLGVSDKWLHSYWRWAEFKYLPMLSEVEPDSAIIEVGCGPGYFMEFLANKGFKNVCGIDISVEQIQLAVKRGLKAQVADVFEFLSARREAFDVVVGLDFLEHFTKDELMELIPIIHASLKKAGRAIFQVPNGQGLFMGQVVYGDITHITIFTPESLSQLLSLHGFTNIRFEETGPIPQGVIGYLRCFLWKCIRQVATLMKKIEAGKTQRIWTENIICCCQK